MSALPAGRKLRRQLEKLAQSVARGHALLALGDRAGARAEARRAAALAPGAPDTLCLLGMVALAEGRNADAGEALQQAFAQAPQRPDVALAFGRACYRLGRWAQAETALRAGLERDPRNADAWVLLGLVLRHAGRSDEAAAAFEQAVILDPGNVSALINRGNVARDQADRATAGSCYRAACAADPDSAVAHYHLGVWLRESGQNDAARLALAQAIERDPAHVEALFNLANVLCDLGRPADAEPLVERALRLRPTDVALLLRCAALLADNDRVEPALAALERAAALAPGDAAVHNNRGMVWLRAGNVEQALAAYDAAIVREPDGAARLNRALALLYAGRWAEGWRDYGARWLDRSVLTRIGDALGCPQWAGESLRGRTVLVVGEQGLGDEVMFASILHEIIAEAGHVVVQCSRKLARLFGRSFGRASVIGIDRTGAQWPEEVARRARAAGAIEVFATLGQLPQYRRASAEAFPQHRGYLRADAARVALWRERLAALGAGAAIGLSWRGGTEATGRNRRSMPLQALLPLLQRRGVNFVSLQYTECGEEIAELRERHGVCVHHFPEALGDYDDTAALVCALDQVVSVCTSVVHLAGALNVPVQVMAPAVPEWRYGCRGDRMPWYPSVRIERQRRPGDWAPVIDSVAARLPGEAAKGCDAGPPLPSRRQRLAEGNDYLQKREWVRACAAYRAVLADSPRDAEVRSNLASALAESGQFEEAVAELAQAVALRPDSAALRANLGTVLHDAGRFGEALHHLEEAVRREPGCAQWRYNLAGPLQALGRLDEAEAQYRRALELDADFADAHNNLAVLLYRMRRVAEALAASERALALDRLNPEYRLNRAYSLLLDGQWSEGWREHEWRLYRGAEAARRRAAQAPRWKGEPIQGRTIVLHAEQGFGDAIQFARYAPLVAQRGARVVVRTYPQLRRLFTSLAGVQAVIAPDEPVPPADYVCSLMSLPWIFGTTTRSVPDAVPYLGVTRDASLAWAERLRAVPGFRLGVCWSGSPRASDPQAALIDARRSMPLGALAPLARVPGVSLVSLQVGERCLSRDPHGGAVPMIDVTEALHDFADTAALIEQLDLVVCVDTSVAHLGAALGRPVWMLSRFDGCWRWLLDGATTPWYPGMRIFRQRTPGDWDGVVREVASSLAELVAARPRPA